MRTEKAVQRGTWLETVIIFTEHMDELASFYQEALEIGPYEHSPGHLGCRVGPVYFGFDQVEGGESSRHMGATLWFTVDDIEDTFNRLVNMGAKVKYPPTEKPWGAVLAAVYDQDGNLLGLSQRKE
jgi:predicted enzyme related to lactoylglutathione lyase